MGDAPGRARAAPAGALGALLCGLVVLLAAFGPALAPADPFATVGPALAPPGRAHPLGTDDLGRDLWAGVAHGARTSLSVAVGVTLLAGAIGLGVGALAGYGGGALDDALMRGTEVVQVLPRFFLAVIVIALFGPGLERLVLVLGATSWPPIARVVRAQALSLRGREYVEAARALGAPARRVLVRHVLPGALPAAIVVISLTASSAIVLEAGLAFIGLGDPRAISWGYLANNAQRFLRVAWWLAAFPGLAIAVAVLGLNLVGDALGDALTAGASGRRARLSAPRAPRWPAGRPPGGAAR